MNADAWGVGSEGWKSGFNTPEVSFRISKVSFDGSVVSLRTSIILFDNSFVGLHTRVNGATEPFSSPAA